MTTEVLTVNHRADAADGRRGRRGGRGKRWAIRLLLVLALLVATIHLAAGWYFSGRIEAGALAVVPANTEYPLQVTAVTDKTVTVKLADGELPDNWMNAEVRGAGIAGLSWAEGYARTFGPPQLNGAETTRSYSLITGTPPTVGTRVGADSFAWPWSKAVPPYTEVAYGELNGQPLTGWFLDASPTKDPTVMAHNTTWGIFVHGKDADPAEHEHSMQVANGLGMPCLDIKYRGDVGQPAAKDNRHAFGQTEWEDLRQAVDYARGQGAKDVVLFGTSMGGAVVAAYLEHTPDAPVRGVLMDAPALDLSQTVEWSARSVPLPGGIVPPRTIFLAAKWLTSLRYGVDWGAVNYLDNIDWVRVPTLIFHGARDSTVPISTSRDLDKQSDLVSLIENPEAEHARSWNLEPESYDAAQRQFLTSGLDKP